MEVAGFARIDLVRLEMSAFSELCCKALESANLNVLNSSSCTFSNFLGSLKCKFINICPLFISYVAIALKLC